jgi:predicted phosphodiesterase
MKILHLTDFHFKAGKSSKSLQEKLVDSLCNSIKNKKPFDLLFFTGDLVYKGNTPEDFEGAYSQLLEAVLNTLDMDYSRLIFCAGNHDVHRDQEMPALNTHFEEKIKTNIALNDFVKNDRDPQFQESYKNLLNYNNFANSKYSDKTSDFGDIIHPLYSIHKREIGSQKIGIATINTAWRAISDHSKGNLLYPITYIQQILSNIKESNLKIILMHHSLEEFNEFNLTDLENEIYQGFLLMFSGHIHKRKQLLQITADEGILCCTSPASLSQVKGEKTGYTILEVNQDSFDVSIENTIYDEQDNIFVSEPKQLVQIPLSEIKREQNEFRRTLRKRFEKEIETSNDLFVSNYDFDTTKLFIDLFSAPVIKTKSKSEIADPDASDPKFNFEDLYKTDKNYIIFGKSKSGRTSLLKRLQIEWLKNFSSFKVIPFFVDCNELRLRQLPLRLINNMASYYEMSQNKLAEKLKTYKTIILIDNFEPEHCDINKEIIEFLKKNKNSYLIATTEELVYRSFEPLQLDDLEFSKLYLHEITRRDLRTLTNKWSTISSGKKELAIEKITKIFDQLHIPYNYWTVSLFLWIFEKFGDPGIHNNIGLIEFYIEGLLEKRKLVLDRSSKINFENLKSYLSELANFLYTKFHNEVYSATYADIIDFTEKYRLENRRFVIDTEEIVKSIIERGIIKRKEDNRYTFRLRGVFEYFLAYYMYENEKFRREILYDNTRFLSFLSEFELYSGIVKKDESFLKSIFEKTSLIFSEINKKYREQGSIDSNLLTRLEEVFDIFKPLKEIPEEKQIPLSPDIKDSILDEVNPIDNYTAEVEKKKIYDEETTITAEILEKYLEIVCKVYRNSYLVKNTSLTNEVFDFIIESSCNFGFVVMDDFEVMPLDVDLTKDDRKFIVKLFAHFMPLVVQAFLSESLNENNLERIYREKIESLKKNSKENQFKLFLLYNLLIDLDLSNNYKLLEELTDIITIGILKISILAKLHFYLRFKSFNNPSLESFLKQKIREYSKIIDEKVDKRFLDKKISIEQKKVLIRRPK